MITANNELKNTNRTQRDSSESEPREGPIDQPGCERVCWVRPSAVVGSDRELSAPSPGSNRQLLVELGFRRALRRAQENLNPTGVGRLERSRLKRRGESLNLSF